MSHCLEGNLSNENVEHFNEFMQGKTEAIEKMANATIEDAKAIAEQAAAEKREA